MKKNTKRDIERAAIIIKVARIVGVSERYVRMVINGERENEAVMIAYMQILEEGKETENKLLNAVKNLVPFN